MGSIISFWKLVVFFQFEIRLALIVGYNYLTSVGKTKYVVDISLLLELCYLNLNWESVEYILSRES